MKISNAKNQTSNDTSHAQLAIEMQFSWRTSVSTVMFGVMVLFSNHIFVFKLQICLTCVHQDSECMRSHILFHIGAPAPFAFIYQLTLLIVKINKCVCFSKQVQNYSATKAYFAMLTIICIIIPS